ncbi:hypothetical protein [Nocardia niigatensis]
MAAPVTAPADTAPAAPDPDSEKPELDLTADSPAEFIEMMRRILHASGLTAGKVAKATEIPRSTAYKYVEFDNTVLPARVEYVEQFARACKLRDDQIHRVVRTWHELNGSTDQQDAEQALTTPEAEPPDKAIVYQAKSLETHSPAVLLGRRRIERQFRDLVDDQHSTHELRELLDVMWSEQNLKRLKKNGGNTPSVLIYNNAPKTTAPLIAGRHAPVRSWAFRRQILVLMVMVLQPMIWRGIIGIPDRTILLHGAFFGVSSLALVLLPQLGRPAVVPSKIRLCIAGGVGVIAAGLTWWATTWPLLALMSGFLVFMAVPMWLAVMDQGQMWKHLFNCSRGYFAVIIAAWFGVLTGVFLATGHGSIVGAVFGATLTAAGVLMEAAARIMPKKCQHCENDEDDLPPLPDEPAAGHGDIVTTAADGGVDVMVSRPRSIYRRLSAIW